MNQIIPWINQQKKRILIGLMAISLFVMSFVFTLDASAQAWVKRFTSTPASAPSPVTTNSNESVKTSAAAAPVKAAPVESVVKEVPAPSQPSTTAPTDSVVPAPANPFQELLTKAQTSFEKTLTQANEAIADLPQQIEQVSSETQSSVRKQLKNQLEDKQDALENVADKIDDLAEKLESFNSKLQKSIQQAKVTVSDKFQQNAQNAQLALENTAKAINDLADDIERAKKNSTPAFRSLIGEEITAVNQSLEAATKAIQAFVENPA